MSEANERPFLFEGATPGIAGGACDDSNPIFHPDNYRDAQIGRLYILFVN
jgi:hypothetical protein